MQKFILLRGHQGSGKSTYAAELIAQFQQAHPNAQIVHIENDQELTNERGEYQWSREALAAAQEKGRARFKTALKQGQQHPERDILIINSNTNQKANACIAMLQAARKHGFQTEVYRLHNFLPNHHNVDESSVLAAYIRLNQNPLRDEIHVPAVQAMSPEQHAQIQAMTQFQNRAPQYDAARHTHITEDYLRHGRRDFSIKASKKYPQLSVLKYAHSVFYENRFDNALLEMRGIVLDPHHQIIIRPFNKVFNYSERIAANSCYPIHIADDHRLTAVVKVNGFLGCCTYVRLPENHPSHGADFDNQILYSTTGSLDSDFAKLVQRHCAQYQALFQAYPNHTFMFEITDPSDVHIIRETFGETLIGIRNVATGEQFTEDELDQIAQQHGIARPQTLSNITFGELKALLKTVEHEGFMVFDADTGKMLFKLKSPYYLISKFLGRSNEGNIGRKLDKRHVDEEYYPLIDHIREHQATFNAMSEHEKIAFIQAFLRKL